MTLELDTVTVDCADPVRVATFWAGALGSDEADLDPEGSWVRDPSGSMRGIFFQPVPEPKTVKNRLHLDLRAPRTMAEEVDRIHALGASVERFVQEGRWHWTVMADPEGNEFCVLLGAAEGAARDRPGLDSIVVDAADWRRVAAFWTEALGYHEHAASDTGIEIVGEREIDPMLSFVQVPEPKTVKNRVHLDVRPDGSMAAEVERVEGLGAIRQELVREEGSFWTVMLDPEGNEFCVLRGPEDGWSRDEL